HHPGRPGLRFRFLGSRRADARTGDFL
ncbi:MAG: hypothetical protein AVDCRST_MAG90-250, partial [uncultured Microvirga sp.]